MADTYKFTGFSLEDRTKWAFAALQNVYELVHEQMKSFLPVLRQQQEETRADLVQHYPTAESLIIGVILEQTREIKGVAEEFCSETWTAMLEDCRKMYGSDAVDAAVAALKAKHKKT